MSTAAATPTADEEQRAAIQPGALADGAEDERERHEGQPGERADARCDAGADRGRHGVVEPPHHRDADGDDQQRQRDLDADHEHGVVAHGEDDAQATIADARGPAPSRRG